MPLPLLTDLELEGKRVLVRFDGDVPVQDRKITDDSRLQAVLQTLEHCLHEGASIVLLAHRGRPEIEDRGELTNEILIHFFQEKLQRPVAFIEEFPRSDMQNQITLFENLRFWPGEEKNDPSFAKKLARLGDIYCNDAFAVSHRAHASVVGLTHLMPFAIGFRFAEEVKQLTPLRDDAEAPYIAILGGAKASDKSPIIVDLIDRADTIVVGGVIAITFLAATGYSVGAHTIEKDQVKLAQQCIRKAHEAHMTIALPIDFMNQHKDIKPVTEFAKDDVMLDIGPATRKKFTEIIHRANTIFWNGAMGKFEDPAFAAGTVAVGRAIASSDADTRIVSGGDTVGAVHQHKLEKGFTFISTGGGATLEFIAGRSLPGIEALKKT